MFSVEKKHCSLCTRNTLLSVQMKEILFSVQSRHCLVYANERNTVSCAE